MNILFVFTIVTISAASSGNLRQRMLVQHHRDGWNNREVTRRVATVKFDRITWLLTKYQWMEDKLNHTAPYSKQRYRQHFMKYFLNGPLK